MKFYARGFNLYLLLAAAVLLAAGCATHKKEDKALSSLRIHIESAGNVAETGKTISVLRAQPVLVTISSEPVLTEANIAVARVIETRGGFAVEIKFDDAGSLILEQHTAVNPGRHLAIFGQWGETVGQSRWLAAPLISRRNGTGVLAFTPDLSRAEADRLVFGLNNAVRQIHKGALKF